MKIEMSTKTSSTDFEKVRIEEGIYLATLKEVKDISEGQYGPRVAFVYKIDEKNVELALVCYKTRATKDNKLGQTLEAHGIVIEDTQVDTDNLPKQQVRAWVEDYTYKLKDGNNEIQKVASVISKVKLATEKPGQ